MRILGKLIFIPLLLSLVACHAKQEGAVEGTIVPPDASAQVSANLEGKTIATVRANGQDGKFRLGLAAGTYTITVSTSASPLPVRLDGVIVKPGETITLPPFQLAPPSGKAALVGRIVPPQPDGEIKLIYEGKERASVHADREGKYEFKELPAGTYEIRASAPGHADDVAPVVIPENETVRQTDVLFPIVAINGVDWAAGKIRATGIGLTPPNAANASAARAMAQRAALADAQRNLLRTVEEIKIDNDRKVSTIMQNRAVATRIQGFLKGYTVVSERELEGGRYEIILELPLTGTAGLSRYITE
ncbi:MAG TPA: carboxypeptidase-like regulatory domain-containing protein [Nitrospirota bacterium]|nr:carboxypeptidase-like regulatory domain-containing protein [Nitrospirota bacterium]